MRNDPVSPERGGIVVCVPDAAALDAVRAVTPADVPVVAASRDNAAAAAGDADVALVADGVRLAAGWLDGLQAARGDDGTVATVEAVAIQGEPLAGAPAPLRPRTAGPEWRCTLIARAAIELAGPLDDGFADRCRAAGLLHVLAGEVVVGTSEPLSPDPDEPEPLRRARRRGRELRDRISVTVDARVLRDPLAGTQVHTLELLAALQRTGELRVRALVPPDPSPDATAMLERIDGIEWLDSSTVDTDTPATAIVHRPYQVSHPIDLLTLRQVGERLVVTHQDLLNFHQAAYHRDRETWESHRRLTYAALEAAHRVVAFSEHAAADLLAEELVRPQRLRVVEIGVDHQLTGRGPEPRAPERGAVEAPFLLCIGTDLRHKNRGFAIELLRELRGRHGWPGRLVFAGSHAAHGGSAADEVRRLDANPELRAAVIDLGPTDEATKAWLYANAAAVIYPTLYEGFGLVPFEAAEHGTPCLFAPQASMASLLRGAARLVPWNAAESADAAASLLTAGPAREALVEAVRAAGAPLTWDRAAQRLLAVYAEALAAERTDSGWAALEAEARRGHWEGMYWKLFNDAGPDGLALVGPEGSLTPSARRALSVLTARPLTRRPLLAVLDALGRRVGGGGS